ncbi:hypothetical protein KKB71_03050 [Patescibacteria group bacterium]|nr:hypothetical protein [Patescibacteria group bacterium]
MKAQKQSGLAPIAIILIIVGVLIICGGGYYLFTQKLTQSQQPIFTPQPTTQDETANWQTYRNEEYGFEMKYPKYLVIDLSYGQDNPRFLNESTLYYSLVISPLTGMIMFEGQSIPEINLTPKDWIIFNLQQRCKTSDTKKIEWENIKIESGIQASSSNDQCIRKYLPWTSIKKNDYRYSFQFIAGSVEEYNQILSTFKFIPQ